jgi:septal ring factor EnvC (AmiA/AmiB activator)
MTVSVPSAENEQHTDQTSDAETTSTKGSSAVAFAAVACRLTSGSSSSRKRIIDETRLSPEEASKLQTRRAYNRDCATRARKKTKRVVAQLEEEVKELEQGKEDLRHTYSLMKAKIEHLEKQNQALMLKQAMSDRYNAAMAASGFLSRPVSLGTASAALSDFRLAALMGGDAEARARLVYQQRL